jgi:hypothetical protein
MGMGLRTLRSKGVLGPLSQWYRASEGGFRPGAGFHVRR